MTNTMTMILKHKRNIIISIDQEVDDTTTVLKLLESSIARFYLVLMILYDDTTYDSNILLVFDIDVVVLIVFVPTSNSQNAKSDKPIVCICKKVLGTVMIGEYILSYSF